MVWDVVESLLPMGLGIGKLCESFFWFALEDLDEEAWVIKLIRELFSELLSFSICGWEAGAMGRVISAGGERRIRSLWVRDGGGWDSDWQFFNFSESRRDLPLKLVTSELLRTCLDAEAFKALIFFKFLIFPLVFGRVRFEKLLALLASVLEICARDSKRGRQFSGNGIFPVVSEEGKMAVLFFPERKWITEKKDRFS